MLELPSLAALCHLGLAAVAGGMLIFAGISKFVDDRPFHAALPAYRLGRATGVVRLALPIAEIAVGASTIVIQVWPTAVLCACVYLGFVAGVARVALSDRVSDCGCFPGAGSLGRVLQFRATLLLALALVVGLFRVLSPPAVYPTILGSVLFVAIVLASAERARDLRATEIGSYGTI